MGIKKVLLTLILFFTMVVTISAQDCYQSSIVSPYPFMGNDGEIFKLADGSKWKVKQHRIYLFMYEYYPKVLICPSEGQLLVDGEILFVEKMGLRL